jgi:hypothetical protein
VSPAASSNETSKPRPQNTAIVLKISASGESVETTFSETTFNNVFAIAVTARSPWLVDRAVNSKIGFHCDFVPHEKQFRFCFKTVSWHLGELKKQEFSF